MILNKIKLSIQIVNQVAPYSDFDDGLPPKVSQFVVYVIDNEGNVIFKEAADTRSDAIYSAKCDALRHGYDLERFVIESDGGSHDDWPEGASWSNDGDFFSVSPATQEEKFRWVITDGGEIVAEADEGEWYDTEEAAREAAERYAEKHL